MHNDAASRSVRDIVPQWQMSGTLDRLQRLLDAGSAAPIEVARRAHLSTSELHALRHLSSQPMGPAELARVLGVTTAAASGVVDRLVGNGHAERRPHSVDGRRTEVHLTDSGRAEAVGHLAPMFAALAALDASLTDEERVVVDRYLDGAIAAVRALL
ncbi:MarR family transcriptional regulator [Nostocoides sp. F2B08]|uniref:MarR family winged helix-turn-helix transcriptional regulator n=1 Tax=Nostocoides sp. F2B08 TaxID=2653936 RepID=UPI0012632908|nr:MarR family transcriptional regulator [Tetrasphaera sp. F2B08]KAB7745629.1 MarR family transcriptional regulator [Tetrasphaera sp. F2B08]